MTMDELGAWGANVDEGLTRCMGNTDIYLRFVGTMKEEQGFGRLRDALAAGDLDAAFEAAHALKGVLGNLSLTPLYEPMCELTEILRVRSDEGAAALLATIMDRREALLAIL